MTYHAVFEISERLPDAFIGVVALAAAAGILALGLRRDGREALRRVSWFCSAAAGVPWMAFEVHDTGGQLGLLLGAIGAGIAGAVAFAAWKDMDLKWSEESRPRFRSVAPLVAVALMLLTGLEGAQQLSAWDLSRQLESGKATVIAGSVQDAHGDSGGYECFTVSADRFCYLDGPTSVGFHQAATNGGPIRNGLHVRVSAIGEVIVRLEIADDQ